METEHEKHFLVISAPHVQFPWLLTSSKQYNKTKHNASHPFSSNLTEVDGGTVLKATILKGQKKSPATMLSFLKVSPFFVKL